MIPNQKPGMAWASSASPCTAGESLGRSAASTPNPTPRQAASPTAQPSSTRVESSAGQSKPATGWAKRREKPKSPRSTAAAQARYRPSKG